MGWHQTVRQQERDKGREWVPWPAAWASGQTKPKDPSHSDGKTSFNSHTDGVPEVHYTWTPQLVNLPEADLSISASSMKLRRFIFLRVSKKVWVNGRGSCFIHFYFHSQYKLPLFLIWGHLSKSLFLPPPKLVLYLLEICLIPKEDSLWVWGLMLPVELSCLFLGPSLTRFLV